VNHVTTIGIGWIALLPFGCSSHNIKGPPPSVTPPAIIVDTVRETEIDDFMRVGFVPDGVKITTLSHPGALRAFVSATPMYFPQLRLDEFLQYSGLIYDDKNVLVAMRCRPNQPKTVDAVLASWPNVFLAIQRDVPVDSATCLSDPKNTATQIACFARAYRDPAATTVPATLAQTFAYAGILFDGHHTDLARWLRENYGISLAFSGTGFSVKDSALLSSHPMTSRQILAKSVSSEYILKNVPLSEAQCHCIAVPSYPGRSGDRLDPEFISQAGGNGTCKSVSRLGTSLKP
jgi:hypothetical protein